MILTVSIVTANNKQLILDCLKSIYETTRDISLEVYVVINDSSDDSEDAVREKFPEVNLIINQSKLGFTHNHNMIMRRGKGKYILVLNDDTIILENSMKRLIDFMEASPDVGIVGPKIFNPDKSLQWSCGKSFNRKFNYLKCGVLAPMFPLLQKKYDNKIFDSDWLTGACLMIRSEAISEVGVFDENIVIYFEDGDLCYRMLLAGWRVVFNPQAQIIHYHGQTRKQYLARDSYIIFQSRFYFFTKHYSFPVQFIVRGFSLIEAVLRYLKAFKFDSTGKSKEMRSAYVSMIRLTLSRSNY